MKTLFTHEKEAKKKELVQRVASIILKGEKQRICSKLESCTYYVDQVKAVNLTIPEAYGYLTLICEKYPSACELNIERGQRKT